MRYIFFVFIITGTSCAMGMDVAQVASIYKMTHGYWLRYRDSADVIIAKKINGQTVCTKGFESNGIWIEENLEHPQWWYNRLQDLYTDQQDKLNMELMIDKFGSL